MVNTENKISKFFLDLLVSDKFYFLIFLLSVAISLFVLVKYIGYPIIDVHGFRQAQTAITAYFMPQNGYNIFSYQTPVLGAPWSIPFEFPFYQTLVAFVSKVLAIDLIVCARVISWMFSIFTLMPIYFLLKKISSDKKLFYIFSALYLICPIYLFWSRAVTIETSVLFFGFMFLLYFVRFADEKKPLDFLLCFGLSIIFILAKATTYPAFCLLALCYMLVRFYNDKQVDKKILIGSFCVFISTFLIAYLWTHHCDILKTQNIFGKNLTSGALFNFNFGTISQRFSLYFYKKVAIYLLENVIGGIWVLCLSFGLFLMADKKNKFISLFFVLLYLIPIGIFSNLYCIHNYYQTANAIFLVFAISILLYQLSVNGKDVLSKMVLFVILTLMLNSFHGYYVKSIKENADKDIYKAGIFVNQVTPQDSAVIVLGMDWSSEINFYAKRKGLALPNTFQIKDFWEVIKNEEKYFDGMDVSAIVVYPEYYPAQAEKIANLNKFITQRYPNFKETKIGNIMIYSKNN